MRIHTRDDTEHGVDYVRWSDAAQALDKLERELRAEISSLCQTNERLKSEADELRNLWSDEIAMVERLNRELAKAPEEAEKHRERKCSESDLTE